MDPVNESQGQSETETQISAATSGEPATPRATSIAPAWHTVVLIFGILAVSLSGGYRHPGGRGVGAANRMHTYALTAGLEVVLIGWVAFGVRLRGVPLRSLFGKASIGFRSIAVDAGIAILFWMGSLMALATLALMWISIESVITHKPIPIETRQSGKSAEPHLPQDQAARAVVQLAPSNGKEIVSWLLLCVLVGIAEELVFRGYLQQQFTAWTRGAAAGGVVFSALMFGAAHGYEGARGCFFWRCSVRFSVCSHCSEETCAQEFLLIAGTMQSRDWWSRSSTRGIFCEWDRREVGSRPEEIVATFSTSSSFFS